METKFNFKSQVCTSKVQSERLLALGLKKETADMVHYKSASMKKWGVLATPFTKECEVSKCYYPAWSLSRIRELLKNSSITISFLERDNSIIVERYGVFQNVFDFWDDVYDNICDAIEWLIKEGYFNKEFLEE